MDAVKCEVWAEERGKTWRCGRLRAAAAFLVHAVTAWPVLDTQEFRHAFEAFFGFLEYAHDQ